MGEIDVLRKLKVRWVKIGGGLLSVQRNGLHCEAFKAHK
jgi:hypothetical protein